MNQCVVKESHITHRCSYHSFCFFLPLSTRTECGSGHGSKETQMQGNCLCVRQIEEAQSRPWLHNGTQADEWLCAMPMQLNYAEIWPGLIITFQQRYTEQFFFLPFQHFPIGRIRFSGIIFRTVISLFKWCMHNFFCTWTTHLQTEKTPLVLLYRSKMNIKQAQTSKDWLLSSIIQSRWWDERPSTYANKPIEFKTFR